MWREMTLVALRSIRGQALRTTLTIGIIGMGIMALIAMVTATESLKATRKATEGRRTRRHSSCTRVARIAAA